MSRKPAGPLRRGWTTGACATAATRSAYHALVTGEFVDPVVITLPKGERPAFPLAFQVKTTAFAQAGIIKDAGDDPDVTHGALIVSKVADGLPGTGVVFRAGEGVGVITKPGLPLPVGEPAINPIPRKMMAETIADLAQILGHSGDVVVEISVPGGAELAKKTWNPRLGIVGGLSILGTTGIVRPFSCSAWIESIRRGIDVAVANQLPHVAGCTGATSEKAVQELYQLPEIALLDMGDFAGGLLKYLRRHPVPRLTIAGGFAKLTKLGQGFMDLHSGRSQVDYGWLAERAEKLGATLELLRQIRSANTANQVLALASDAGIPLGDEIAQAAWHTAVEILQNAPIKVEVLIFDRDGNRVGRSYG